MNSIKFKIRLAVLLSFLMVVSSCDDDFDEINTDPTKFTDIDEGFQFAWVINRMVAERFEQWRGNMIYNSEWVQHFAGTWSPDLYDVSDETFLSAQWNKTYVDYLKNMDDAISRTTENSNKNLIARVIRVFFMQRLTDMHGDIPYTEAGKDLQISNPVYDTQESIYRDFVSELTTASTGIDVANTSDSFLGQDPIYGGDLTKWRKFTNSLLLRVGMRMSEVDPAAAEDAVRTALTGGVFESNDDIAFLPFNEAFSGGPRNGLSLIFQENGIVNHGFSYSDEVVTRLQTNNDPRIPILMANYETVGTDIVEVPTAPGDFEGRENGNPGGLDLSHAQPNRSTVVKTDAPSLLFTFAETEFLKAEAYLRGWGSGDPKTAYESGVTAACKQLGLYTGDEGVSDADIATLLAEPEMVYDAAKGLEQIITQKWLSLIFNGYEAFSEYRRTGFPVLTPGITEGVAGGEIPSRMRYPALEASANTDNYNDAVSRLGGNDDVTAHVWWDVD